MRLLTLLLASLTPAFAVGPAITVTVIDQDKVPVAGARVSLTSSISTVTDETGHAHFVNVADGEYAVSAGKDGFEIATERIRVSGGNSQSIELKLSPAVHRESINVTATPSPIGQSTSGAEVPTQTVKQLPGRPATVSDALPLVPGVARTPGGGLQISGAGEHRSALIVNSADVTDPATGQFGLSVPIDSVEVLSVYQAPFLAEYGRFTAGLVSVETRRGGDQWKWELNDPFPEFFIRSWQLRGLRTATPRFNFEGPIIPGKLFFSEGFEYDLRKTPVYTLPFPQNLQKQQGVNSFAQLDWVISDKQLVTATAHVAPQRLDFVNMNYFNPRPTTPDASTHNYTGTVADRWTAAGGLLENTVSFTRFDAGVWGHGPENLTIAPQGNTGNYFAQLVRAASRAGWSATYSLPSLAWLGSHNVKVGSYVGGSSETGNITEHPVEVVDGSNQLLERIAFTGGQPVQMADKEYAFFGQDHWILSPHLAVDAGLRTESQQLSEALRLAPRTGMVWSPSSTLGTVVRAGIGMFYDRVPLNVYSFSQYPNEVVTIFDSAGQISAGPFTYVNGIGTVMVRPPLVFAESVAGNFSPKSMIWSAQVEQPITKNLKLRIGYMQNNASGLVTMNLLPPDPTTSIGQRLLSGGGQSRYRQFETTARIRLRGGPLMFSYVRSRARGDLNDFASFLGTFPVPLIRPNQFANLSTDLPNRFLAWGVVKLPFGFGVAPTIEFRTGFPYSVLDAAQNYVGTPNSSTFPNFFSADARVWKDIKVNPKYSVRFSVSGFNLTDYYNPEAVHYNIADPTFGMFFGQRGRHFTADFDVLF